MTIGTTTWYPRWQFTPSGTRPDLKRLLSALADARSDPIVADRVMRLSREDLDGLSLAEALDDRAHSDAAWRILSSMGDQD
jgi:DNA invertase Pin-like site-specific DNA recombinase